jgi:hypothetical protein
MGPLRLGDVVSVNAPTCQVHMVEDLERVQK